MLQEQNSNQWLCVTTDTRHHQPVLPSRAEPSRDIGLMSTVSFLP